MTALVIMIWKHPVVSGLVVGVATYALILAWRLLARRGKLPRVVARPVSRFLDRLDHLPLLGRPATVLRRRPLVVATVAGILMPILVISVYALVGMLLMGVAGALGVLYGGSRSDEDEIDPNRLYIPRHTGEVVYGNDIYADENRPYN